MEKQENDNKPVVVVDGEDSIHSKADSDEKPEQLYFTKDGRELFGVTPPTAFAVSYPYPPLPSNLAKNRVLRVSDEQTKESVQEGIVEAEKEFAKEAMPLPSLALHGSSLPKLLIPEIELAIYWDRHPYEFRTPDKQQTSPDSNKKSKTKSAGSIRRSKSEMNLASQVGKVLEEYSLSANSNNSTSRRSSVSASDKTIRSSTVTAASSSKSLGNGKSERLSPKNSHYEEHLAFPSNGNDINDTKESRVEIGKCDSGNCGSRKQSANTNDGSPSLKDGNNDRENGRYSATRKNNTSSNVHGHQSIQMSENERKKFGDIKQFHHQSERHTHGFSRPKLIRSEEQLGNRKSTGVQVAINDVTAAALKSTYLCPLHGQYQRGIERRDKGGFRTDMGSLNNSHTHCSRALRGIPSRTKMIKTVETQTDGEGESGPLDFGNVDNRFNKRSKTAGHNRNPFRKGKEIMSSEYHGSFRDPYKIAESEKRHLRNKILNYCFTKHSIF